MPLHPSTAARASRLGPALAGALLLHALPALACPVCFSAANERVLQTYYVTVALLSALPLAIIGTIGWWLHRNARSEPSAPPGG